MPALLSANLNKVALLRNSRGRNVPDLLAAADAVIAAGARGITVHPRRDQRHILIDDVPLMAAHLRATHPEIELNVECEDAPELIELVCEVRPDQCTLVPVTPGEVTSDHGWDLPRQSEPLAEVVARLTAEGIRVSAFADCVPERVAGFAAVGVDRVELYTGPFAWAWGTPDQARETDRIWATGAAATEAGLGINAGHDLDRHNLAGVAALPGLLEVSIGHALMCRALEVGIATATRELVDALAHDRVSRPGPPGP